MPIDPLLREVIAQFADEASERAAVVARCVLALERFASDATTTNESWTTLKRELHTLKGTAATAGLDEAASIAHRLESLLVDLPRNRALPPQIASAILAGTDSFLARIRADAADARSDAEAEQNARAHVDDDDNASSWRVKSDDVLGFLEDIERLRELRLRLDERVRDLDSFVGALGSNVNANALQLRADLVGVRRALAGDAEEAADVVASLEESVKAITTLPLRTILEPLHRVVRDVCASTGKKAALSLVGADLAIDRRLLEALRAPLIHLVRNAVDHGVEDPNARKRSGKHEAGAVVVRAEQEGNALFVEVSDDGGGMSADRILAEAVRLGVVDASHALSLSREEVLRLAFHQGLSTKSAVSSTSGRGVGLDVVARDVRALRGDIDVVSAPGQGTRFLLHLPVDLGSSAVLVVGVGEHVVGVPMLTVEAVAAASPASVVDVGGALHLEHRDRRLPLFDLGALLATRSAAPPARGAPILVVHEHGRRIAVCVDVVVGDRDLVVRPLPAQLATLPAYQGAAVLAKGDLILVLRSDWLTAHGDDARVRSAPLATTRATSGVERPRRRVLVVDDSLTARALHRTILEAGGYAVNTVASVERAEEQLVRARYDAVVCDLTFASGARDGFDLLRAMRDTNGDRATAFVLVSVADDVELRGRARALGADAYITKKECAAGRLLGEVSSVLERRRTA